MTAASMNFRWTAKHFEEVLPRQGADGRLRLAEVWWLVPDPAVAKQLQHLTEPDQQLSASYVSRLPAAMEESAPCACEKAVRIVAPCGVPGNVGHTFLEVLHVGAGLQTSYVPAS